MCKLRLSLLMINIRLKYFSCKPRAKHPLFLMLSSPALHRKSCGSSCSGEAYFGNLWSHLETSNGFYDALRSISFFYVFHSCHSLPVWSSLNLGFYHSSTYQSLSNHHWLSYLFTLGKEHALLSRPNTISPVLYIVSVFNLHFLNRHH